MELTDGRLIRGARSRRLVARLAADVASVDGLTGLSLGRLAGDLGLSKSGVQALFVTKENLQLAAIDAAREAFGESVVQPALAAPAGVARLRALVDNWIDYATAPLFPGGCFWAATLPDFDSRPGPVRDALTRDQADWRATLTRELHRASELGEIPPLDARLTAFQIDAVLTATNTALRLGDADAVAGARRILDGLVAGPRPAHEA